MTRGSRGGWGHHSGLKPPGPQRHSFYVTSSQDSPTTSYDWFRFSSFLSQCLSQELRARAPGVSGIFPPIDSTLPWEGCTTPAPVQRQRATKILLGHLIEQGDTATQGGVFRSSIRKAEAGRLSLRTIQAT